MAMIRVSNLTFAYEGSFDYIFENVSFTIDTDWKLGFVGRNGKGKTTFLRLLLGDMEYQGSIQTSTKFDYFPYQISKEMLKKSCVDFMEELKPNCELWRVLCELEELEIEADVLYRPFGTLSHGERTKVMLAILFSSENEFLLVDEPTNHLDVAARSTVLHYLQKKKGFILVSHDRDLLDACVDHVLVLNRCSIEVQTGNFSSWWENKTKLDAFKMAENEKHKNEIAKLEKAAKRNREWASKNEATKIGFDPIKEHERNISTRAYIGAKTKKMQSRVKNTEQRIQREIEEKEGLLNDIESVASLKILPLTHRKNTLIELRDYGVAYEDAKDGILSNLNFQITQGERVCLRGKNGCGKSTVMKAILSRLNKEEGKLAIRETGVLQVASNLVVSYVQQDTSFLHGSIKDFCKERALDEALFCALLRQLDFERVQFVKNMEEYSEGQKKKVLIAASLITKAHIYVWDEPLNYIDVFSKMQIEQLILQYQPTMLFVEHDHRFCEKIATKIIDLG